MDEPPAKSRPWWPHVRAALILAHLFGIVVASLPAPVDGDKAEYFETPVIQEELRRWSRSLSLLGLSVEPQQLGKFAQEAASSWLKGWRILKKPFEPYYRYFGTRQSWRMFAGANTHNNILEILVLEGRQWRMIYRARSDEFSWRRSMMDHETMRSMLYRYHMTQKRYRSRRRDAMRALAKLAFEDFPQARKVRLQLAHGRTPSPQESREGIERKTSTKRKVEFRRRELMPKGEKPQ